MLAFCRTCKVFIDFCSGCKFSLALICKDCLNRTHHAGVALRLRVESNASICDVSRDYRVGHALCHALSFQSCFACHMLVATREFCTPD